MRSLLRGSRLPSLLTLLPSVSLLEKAAAWRPWRPRRRGRRRATRPRTFLVVVILIALGAAGCTGVTYAKTPLPTEPQDGVTDEGSVIYYADGRTPLMRIGANREVVRHEQIPDRLRWAVLAAEDRGFYREMGVSPNGVARALVNNVTGGEVQGGSTITQQLARNYYKGLSQERSLGRKSKEIFVAVKLDRHETKEQILDRYLNTIFFGRQASGVQTAARAYFHKDVWALDVAESALLAAMIQRPTYFKTQGDDPAARALRARWRYVIDGMVEMGHLSRRDADGLRFPRTQPEWTEADDSGQSPLVRERVVAELRRLGISEQDVVNGGWKIYTGLDRRWMGYAAESMRRAQESRWPEGIRAGLVAVDPGDGAVRALYGGDPGRDRYDTVFTPVAQAGSTFKPYVLAAALKQGFSVRSLVDGSAPQRFAPDGNTTPLTAPGYLVDNDEKIGSVGTVDLVAATALSVNTGFVRLGFAAGLDNVRTTAEDLGVPSGLLDPFKGQAGIVLGTPSIPVVNQAAAYAAFANGGTAVEPHVITKLVDGRGHTVPLPWDDGEPRRVLTAEQVAQVTYTLRAVVSKGTGRAAALADRPVAGKTGTTDRNRAAWFAGYVPRLSATVMLANAENAPITGIPGQRGVVDGGNVPARIWRDFMERVTAGTVVEDFPMPAFTGEVGRWGVPDATPDAVPAPPPAGPADPAGTGEPGRDASRTPPSAPPSTPVPTCKPGRGDSCGRPPADERLVEWCADPGNASDPACAKVGRRT